MSNTPSGSDIPPSYSVDSGGAAVISQDDKTMAMLAYILGIFTGFIGPLIIWLMKKDQSKFVAFHAMQALIFQVVIVIGYIVSSFLVIVLIGFLTYPACAILSLVYSIIAGMAANRGEWYEIPIVGKFARQQTGM